LQTDVFALIAGFLRQFGNRRNGLQKHNLESDVQDSCLEAENNRPQGPQTDATSSRTLRLVLYDSIASEAMNTVTTGVFLAGFAVVLGASNFAIGVLASIPFFVQLLQLPAVALVERIRSRRAVSVWASGSGRMFLLAAALVPLVLPAIAIPALIALIAVHQALAAVSGCAWNSWMRDLVPEERRGRFFGRRIAANTAVAAVVALMGGGLLDLWKAYLPSVTSAGYSILFSIGALIGLVGVCLLAITPEPPMTSRRQTLHLVERLSIPLRDRNFRNLLRFMSSWNFATNLAAPFFAVYMLKSLGYPITVVIVLSTVSQIANVAALALWGPLIDRFNNKAVLDASAPIFLGCVLAWTFTGLSSLSPITPYLIILLHVLMGFSTAGVALASSNLAMKLAPREEATSYLAVISVVPAISAALAPMLGGLTADFFGSHQLTLSLTWASEAKELTMRVLDFHDWTFFFIIAFFVGLFSLHRLSRVEEAAGFSDRLLARDLLLEARRSIHSLSSAAGLARMARIPGYLFTRMRREHPNRRRRQDSLRRRDLPRSASGKTDWRASPNDKSR
jgi:MFS family permease